ncbi:hypothetical protein DPMN_010396 [Dreissena polymorpha]|uniref:Uncharacterized protein n=1 Tax=Dreissena polymorpha TaxID=45954 RepID=A0A9D4N241_DREPO|nr:hypothetical protein DPMN_010396 [Dreissena polymorpha]
MTTVRQYDGDISCDRPLETAAPDHSSMRRQTDEPRFETYILVRAQTVHVSARDIYLVHVSGLLLISPKTPESLKTPESTQVNPSRPKSTQVDPSQPKSTQVDPSRPKSTRVNPSRHKSTQVDPSQPK